MKIGKLPNEVLEKIVFSNIKNRREEVLVRAAVGEDNAIIDFGENVCVMSTDPITGATKDIGSLAIHISCNDVSTSGAEPIGILMTILVPPLTTEKELEEIMIDAGKTAKELNVEIIGGHTEVTDAVNRVVISTTVIGKQKKSMIPNYNDINIGDKVVITKYIGIEGTSILAKELEYKLIEKLEEEKIKEAQNMDSMLSVVKEGTIASKLGAKYMHDITEGGILGAVWEASKAVSKGIKIFDRLIPIKDVTKEISNVLGIDPYKLISSGSMLIIMDENKFIELEQQLKDENIKATIIGEVVENGVFLDNNGELKDIDSPESDELYKALNATSNEEY